MVLTYIDRPLVTVHCTVLLDGKLFLDCLRTDRCVRFTLHEVRQQVVPAPARIAESKPVLIVSLTTPAPKHAIQYSATTQCSALRNVSWSSIEIDLRHGREVPIVDAADIVADEAGDVDDRLAAICWAGLEEQNVDRWVFREAVRDRKTCRSASYDLPAVSSELFSS